MTRLLAKGQWYAAREPSEVLPKSRRRIRATTGKTVVSWAKKRSTDTVGAPSTWSGASVSTATFTVDMRSWKRLRMGAAASLEISQPNPRVSKFSASSSRAKSSWNGATSRQSGDREAWEGS
eukprot:CAMPEP_0118991352 /NCGR_PEP_ID=MMETSP1173-20130426/51504_1 /TAXON_ID=1034831 /ORGANISM="Rhizochromulina marina cf, Strain CCMP1243" /LENGTH=121 /DNA_ID=CAMNT_0006942473 /DNA_START=200 /DNA_END=565 /DNA_ORIENTATION=+